MPFRRKRLESTGANLDERELCGDEKPVDADEENGNRNT